MWEKNKRDKEIKEIMIQITSSGFVSIMSLINTVRQLIDSCAS
jgi:hypothetical protein